MAGAGGVPAALSGAEEAAPREGAGLLVAPGAELDKARGAALGVEADGFGALP